jgi:predicted TIM-barrel fold metal-dependent hydrolase
MLLLRHNLPMELVHALSDNNPASNTLCGKNFGSFGAGESSISTPVANSEWITCPECRNHLEDANMTIEKYQPRSTLVVPEKHPTCARYPFIDVHNHQDALMSADRLDGLIEQMDALRLRVMVNLNGGFGERLQHGVQNMSRRYPGRFVLFANIDFSSIDSPDYYRRAADQFEADVRDGAQGLKIFKNLGMDIRDRQGSRIRVDDPRLDALFECCAALNTPVLIHTADPKPFFEPIDQYNERWLELRTMPTRWHPPDRCPSWQTLIDEQHRLFARHPKTLFINAHLGWMGGDLAELGTLLDRLPNMYTEFGAVIAELGRQPRQARAWFARYQDRILFGKDGWHPAEYHTCFRVLETADEYFDHYRRGHGLWKLYGLDLPQEVLRKVYYENALRILPGVDPGLFS